METWMPKAISPKNCYYLLVDCANWSEISQGASVRVGDTELKGPLIPLLPFLQNFDDYKKSSDNSVYLEFEYIFTALCRASNIALLDLRQWYVLPIPSQLLSRVPEGNDMKVSFKPLGSNEFTTYSAHRNFGKPKIIPSLFRSSWEKAFYGVENLNGLSDSRYEEKIESVSTYSGEMQPGFPVEERANLYILEVPGKSFSEIQTAKKIQSNTSDCCLRNLPAYDKSSTWIVTWRGEVEYGGKESKVRPVEVTASVYARDSKGIESRYVSPWVPSKLILNPGVNKFELSFPFKPSSVPGNIDRIEIKDTAIGMKYGSDALKNTEIEIIDSIPFPDKSNYRVY
jgi:hypothetical protein